jgi:hypothetical protein
VLAFFFGYALTIRAVLKAGLALGAALPIAFASDTISITVMEIVDNAIMVVVPGAMEAGLDSVLFWGALAFALAVAFVITVPVNRWLISRGKGHAVMHSLHGAGHGSDGGRPRRPLRPARAAPETEAALPRPPTYAADRRDDEQRREPCL